MSINRFKDGILYELQEPYDDDLPSFRFALPAAGAAGMWLADCWIVNAQGHRHPGVDACPVPVEASSLKREVRPMACGFEAKLVFDGPWLGR